MAWTSEVTRFLSHPRTALHLYTSSNGLRAGSNVDSTFVREQPGSRTRELNSTACVLFVKVEGSISQIPSRFCTMAMCFNFNATCNICV